MRPFAPEAILNGGCCLAQRQQGLGHMGVVLLVVLHLSRRSVLASWRSFDDVVGERLAMIGAL